MSDPATRSMTVDEFFAWYDEQPEGGRYELVAGRVVPIASERLAHARTKFRVARRLAEAAEAVGLDCEVLGDGVAVLVDETTFYEPDALIRCGAALPDTTVRIEDPVVVVEVVSPGSSALDSGWKLIDYFKIASVRHYLIVRTECRSVIQHTRREDGNILTRIAPDGAVELDPPGIPPTNLFG